MAVGFGTDKFRDVFAYVNGGLPSSAYAAGAASGSAINLANAGKTVFHLQIGTGSAGATVNLVLTGASASNGTFTSFTSLATTSVSATSNTVQTLEIRGEAVAGLNLGYTWVKPVLNVVGSVQASVLVNQFVLDYNPASFYDTASYVSQEVDFF